MGGACRFPPLWRHRGRVVCVVVIGKAVRASWVGTCGVSLVLWDYDS